MHKPKQNAPTKDPRIIPQRDVIGRRIGYACKFTNVVGGTIWSKCFRYRGDAARWLSAKDAEAAEINQEPINIASEYFILYRAVGTRSELYAQHERRKPLEDVIKNNPDFTVPQDGAMPRSAIVRYIPVRED